VPLTRRRIRSLPDDVNAWNTGDANALAALYVENGMRTDNNQMKDQMASIAGGSQPRCRESDKYD
jgi:hypothetical protein